MINKKSERRFTLFVLLSYLKRGILYNAIQLNLPNKALFIRMTEFILLF